MLINDVLLALDTLAPFKTCEKWDNCGLLIGDENALFSGALLALDVTDAIINEAIEKSCNLIITHHPIIFNPLKSINSNSLYAKIIKNNINIISAHTNLDKAEYGVNYALAKALKIDNIMPFAEISPDSFYGFIGDIAPIKAKDFALIIKKALNVDMIKVVNGEKIIKRLAICSGAGSEFTDFAITKNADAYLTGEIKHNIMIDAVNNGLVLFDAGHFATENIIMKDLKIFFNGKFPNEKFEIAEKNISPCEYI